MELSDDGFVEEMAVAYVECALWSSTDWETQRPLDEDHDSDDLAPEALTQMRLDVDAFFHDNADMIRDNMTPAQAGHDFWLTRNGHGAGFWDRGLGAVGDALTKASKPYGSSDLYVGDDGKVYVN